MTFLCLALTASAVRAKTGYRVVRLSDGTELHVTRSSSPIRRLAAPKRTWDADKTYRVPVVLMSFSDCDFLQENPKEFYDRLFNEKGFNLGKGPGCVADYFRDQSNGLFNLQFDVVGPVKIAAKQKTSSKERYGQSDFKEAVRQTDDMLDYTNYDWNGDQIVDIVVVVYAGYGGNEASAESAQGCIWPNTSSFSKLLTLDGMKVYDYSASSELWTNNASCGIGTICHEFSHSLGLPDLYPTGSDEYSVLDEWDLMDGGNFNDDGWCPPNYSIHEREYLGWQSPVELSEPVSVTNLSALGSGGEAYKVVNSAHALEYYLLENRQWDGWDMMLPGHGLLITHVDFDSGLWADNRVNTTSTHHRLEYFHADNLDFTDYDEMIGSGIPYGGDGRNRRLQFTAYPYTDAEGVVHDALTDQTLPAATLFQANANGVKLMGKAVTAIQEENGLISFWFSNVSDGIAEVSEGARQSACYDLSGRRVLNPRPGSVYIVRYEDGSVRKIKL